MTSVVADPPRGWGRVAALGPGFLWMVSAAGSGELLFTPRVGAQYGYALLWALLAAVILKWFINREIGRFAVCTGASIIDGIAELPGPRHWALWLILLPQAFVAVTAIAGLAGSAATALVLLLPGSLTLWMIAATLASAALVLWGRYRRVEQTATALATLLALASVIAAVAVGPRVTDLARGLVPRIPSNVDYAEVLPWLGFMLSGAAGLMWYSYWIRAKGYGARHRVRPSDLPAADRHRLRQWINQMTLDCTVAVAGTLLITVAFLVLGSEVLRPTGRIPEEARVAETLGLLLGDLWGPVGFWFMILGVFVGFWDTVLSDQDGHGRLFANGVSVMLRRAGLQGRWTDEPTLQKIVVVALVTAAPIILFLAAGQPVGLLVIAGVIEAAHIPVVVAFVLALNRRLLPGDLRPSPVTTLVTAAAGLFFAIFAVLYVRGLS